MDGARIGVWVCLSVIVVSTITDIKWREMPNILTLGGIALGFGLHAAIGYADDGAAGAVRGACRAGGGLLLCAIMPVLSFVRGEMGGGDVKLFAAIGALLGPMLGFDVQASTFLIMLAVVLPWRVVRSGTLRTSLSNVRTAVGNVFRPRERRVSSVPVKLPPMIMGPTIFAGFCLAMARHWPLP